MLVQPNIGAHRSGSDAVFLAASLRDQTGVIADLGAGCGAVGLMAAHLNPEADIWLAEHDPIMLASCAQSLERNPTLAQRTTVMDVDLLAPEQERVACGLKRASVDHVLANPPYRRAGHVRANPNKQDAHVVSPSQLEGWVRTAASILKPGGSLTLIFGGDGLDDVLRAFGTRFGAVTILGLHPQEGGPAERLLIRGIKGRKTPPAILPGFILHEADGSYTKKARAVLEGRNGLDLSNGF